MKKARKKIHIKATKCKQFNSSYLKKESSGDFKLYPDLFDYLANLWLKAHVQHAICLIEHQVGAAA